MGTAMFMGTRLFIGGLFIVLPIVVLAKLIAAGHGERIVDTLLGGLFFLFMSVVVGLLGHVLKYWYNTRTRGYPFDLKVGDFVVDRHDGLWYCYKVMDHSPWDNTKKVGFTRSEFRFVDRPGPIEDVPNFAKKEIKGEDMQGWKIIDSTTKAYRDQTSKWAEYNLEQ